MDKTNARHIKADMLAMPAELIVCDASFISSKTAPGDDGFGRHWSLCFSFNQTAI